MDNSGKKGRIKNLIVGFVALALVGVYFKYRYFPSLESRIEASVRQLNKDAPKMVDANIRFDHADPRPPNGIAYTFTLMNLPSQFSSERKTAFQEEISRRELENPEFSAAVKSGIAVYFFFNDEAGRNGLQFKITPRQ